MNVISYFTTTISNTDEIKQLQKLCFLTHDNDIFNEKSRNILASKMFIVRKDGWNIITSLGIEYLHKNGYISP